MKNILPYILLITICLSSCSDDDGLSSEVPSFSKLYFGAENIEAIDFIEKEDGYLILATIFNNSRSAFYLIDTNFEGYVQDTIRVKSDTLNTFDRGISIKQYGNEVYILGTNSNSLLNAGNTSFKSLVFKTDLNGNPIKNESDTSESIATIKFLVNSEGYSMKMNDFIIKDDKIIFGGSIYNNNNTGEIVQVYNLESFNEINYLPTVENEYPNELKIDNTNTSVLRVFEGKNNSIKFTTIGQNTISNDENADVEPSRNIVRKVYTQYNSPSPFTPRIYSPNQENLGDALQDPITGTFYYAGSYGSSENNLLTDDLFLIRDDFNPLIDSENQLDRENTNNNIDEGFGNFVVSIAQNSLGNIYIASTTRLNNLNIGPSNLFKFSASGDLLSEEPIEFVSSRFYNIKKIKVSRQDDKILVLSSLEFENNARAVGLLKLNF